MTKFIRFAGFLTAIIYSATTVFAQPGSLATVSSSSHPEVRTSVEGLSIPATLGTVQAAFNAANVKPSVFLIQDAHAVRDAQLHIRQLIDHLQREFGVGLVLLEGGKGKIDPTLVRTFPDAFLKEKIMTDYQNRGELTGAEMAAVLNPREAKYYGIEDWNLYQQHYLAYLKAAEGKESVLKTLEKIRENLDREREKVYSVKFNEFHRQWEKFEKENAYLVELLTYLVQTQKPQTSILQKYPDLAKLYRAFEFEKDENQNKQPVDISIRRMAESLKVKALRKMNIKQEIAFHKNYQSFVTGQMEAGKFLKFLVELGEALGVKAKLTPVMLKLLGHNETLETIKGTHLYDELDQWVRETESSLIATPQERVIAENYRRLKLLEALARLELTRGEWGQIQAYRIGRGADSNLLNITRYPLEAKLFAPALEFYRLALERDEAFSRNIGKLLKDQRADAAIVVAGGFHTEGFEKNLKEAGYSYAVITPKIGSLEGQETYASVMAGKRSYQNRPGSTFYDAFIRASSVELMDELNEQDFRQTLRLWRDELLRNLSSEGRIAEAGEYTPYMDALFKVYYEKFGEGKKTAATGEQILKAIEKELDRYKQETLSGLWARFEPQLKEFRIGLESLRERKELTAQNIALLLDHVGQVKPSTLGAPLALARKIGFDSPDLISWQNTGKLPAGLSNTVQTGARELSESIRSETRAEQPGIQAISFKYYQAMPEDLFPKQSSVSPVGWFEKRRLRNGVLAKWGFGEVLRYSHHPDNNFLIAYSGGKPVAAQGFVLFPETKEAVDQGIYTDEKYRKQGVASQLRNALLLDLKNQGYQTFQIGRPGFFEKREAILRENPTQHFHKKFLKQLAVVGALESAAYWQFFMPEDKPDILKIEVGQIPDVKAIKIDLGKYVSPSAPRAPPKDYARAEVREESKLPTASETYRHVIEADEFLARLTLDQIPSENKKVETFLNREQSDILPYIGYHLTDKGRAVQLVLEKVMDRLINAPEMDTEEGHIDFARISLFPATYKQIGGDILANRFKELMLDAFRSGSYFSGASAYADGPQLVVLDVPIDIFREKYPQIWNEKINQLIEEFREVIPDIDDNPILKNLRTKHYAAFSVIRLPDKLDARNLKLPISEEERYQMYQREGKDRNLIPILVEDEYAWDYRKWLRAKLKEARLKLKKERQKLRGYEEKGREALAEKVRRQIQASYEEVSHYAQRVTLAADMESVARVEAVEKMPDPLKQEPGFNQWLLTATNIKDVRDNLRRKNEFAMLGEFYKAFIVGRDRLVPPGEYPSGKIPRLSHMMKQLEIQESPYSLANVRLAWDELNQLPNDENLKKFQRIYAQYRKARNEMIVRADRDIRMPGIEVTTTESGEVQTRYTAYYLYKEAFLDEVYRAARQGELGKFKKHLMETGMEALVETISETLIQGKRSIGDEFYGAVLVKSDKGHRIDWLPLGGEYDGFNAWNKQYPPDKDDHMDGVFHQGIELALSDERAQKVLKGPSSLQDVLDFLEAWTKNMRKPGNASKPFVRTVKFYPAGKVEEGADFKRLDLYKRRGSDMDEGPLYAKNTKGRFREVNPLSWKVGDEMQEYDMPDRTDPVETLISATFTVDEEPLEEDENLMSRMSGSLEKWNDLQKKLHGKNGLSGKAATVKQVEKMAVERGLPLLSARSEVREEEDATVIPALPEDRRRIGSLLQHMINNKVTTILGGVSLISDSYSIEDNRAFLEEISEPSLEQIERFSERFSRNNETVFFRSKKDPNIILNPDTEGYWEEWDDHTPSVDRSGLGQVADFEKIHTILKRLVGKLRLQLEEAKGLVNRGQAEGVSQVLVRMTNTKKALAGFLRVYKVEPNGKNGAVNPERDNFIQLLHLLNENWWLIQGLYSPWGNEAYPYHDKYALKFKGDEPDAASIRNMSEMDFEKAKVILGDIIHDRIRLGKLEHMPEDHIERMTVLLKKLQVTITDSLPSAGKSEVRSTNRGDDLKRIKVIDLETIDVKGVLRGKETGIEAVIKQAENKISIDGYLRSEIRKGLNQKIGIALGRVNARILERFKRELDVLVPSVLQESFEEEGIAISEKAIQRLEEKIAFAMIRPEWFKGDDFSIVSTDRALNRGRIDSVDKALSRLLSEVLPKNRTHVLGSDIPEFGLKPAEIGEALEPLSDKVNRFYAVYSGKVPIRQKDLPFTSLSFVKINGNPAKKLSEMMGREASAGETPLLFTALGGVDLRGLNAELRKNVVEVPVAQTDMPPDLKKPAIRWGTELLMIRSELRKQQPDLLKPEAFKNYLEKFHPVLASLAQSFTVDNGSLRAEVRTLVEQFTTAKVLSTQA